MIYLLGPRSFGRDSGKEIHHAYGQFPPFGIGWADVSLAHRRSQVALVQLTEQEPVQVMWQVELPLQDTLPLGPTVVVHVEFPVQARLHESRHSPEHVVWFSHESEQLPASPPQVPALKAQLVPELQEQVAPLHVGGGAELDPPQAPRTATTTMASRVRIRHLNAHSRSLGMSQLTQRRARNSRGTRGYATADQDRW